MAEIKSALEIAMERAAALGRGEDDSKRQAREKGHALARQALEGDLSAADMAIQLGQLIPEARLAAGETLLEALRQERPTALPCLASMCAQEPARQAYGQVAQAHARRAQARQEVESELAREMLAELAEWGVGGSAVRPNPVAHPDYQARYDAALAGAEQELKTAGDALLRALA